MSQKPLSVTLGALKPIYAEAQRERLLSQKYLELLFKSEHQDLDSIEKLSTVLSISTSQCNMLEMVFAQASGDKATVFAGELKALTRLVLASKKIQDDLNCNNISFFFH